MIPSFASMFIIFASVHGYLIHIYRAFSKPSIMTLCTEMKYLILLNCPLLCEINSIVDLLVSVYGQCWFSVLCLLQRHEVKDF
jgi:hypothetical protein